LGGIYQGIVGQFVFVDRFFEVFEQPVSSVRVPCAAPSAEGAAKALELRNVSYRYPSGEYVLRGASLAIAPGEVVALVGQSGVGKTTVSKLLTGLVQPEDGEVRVFGRALSSLSDKDKRGLIGIVLQDTPLLNHSVRDNVTFSRDSYDEEEYRRVLALTGVDSAVDTSGSFARGALGENGAGISVGQRQRIGLAMALIKRPRVLILDEATNQLDAESEAQILTAIRLAEPDLTMLLISVRDSVLGFADRVLRLDDGRVDEVPRAYPAREGLGAEGRLCQSDRDA
jgi:ABC-type multidrug transport system fused ATPase/permease subunit